jgi:uroporphyrin-III C-methyltransferase/precorrin-2 dehydrogenase/sirohydrochlorin ferrochelatase
MDALPISFPLQGRRVVLFGGGERARAKLEILTKTPAAVEIYADGPSEALAGENVTVRSLWPSAESLEGAAFAIVALEDLGEARAAARLAREAGLLVNAVDRPELSDFHMPAIVDRGDVTISVATAGGAPALARHVRGIVEAALPASVASLATFAKRVRGLIADAEPDHERRRTLWDRVLMGAAGEHARAGNMLRAEIATKDEIARGRPAGLVHIVGAGPGDPELLTLKALRVLQEADVIFYDRLVEPSILDLARRDARRAFVGKARGKASVAQDDINDQLVREARAGSRVVRLKGGDPFVFGRGGEELDVLKAAGVAAFVVPGITAALGVAASTGAPLTHRDHAQAVTFITGHTRSGDTPDVEWAQLAGKNHTLVVYMGAGNAPKVAEQLIAAGRAAATPVLIVENGTRPDQRALKSSLETLGADAQALDADKPALLIIGEVAALADGASVARLIEQVDVA